MMYDNRVVSTNDGEKLLFILCNIILFSMRNISHNRIFLYKNLLHAVFNFLIFGQIKDQKNPMRVINLKYNDKLTMILDMLNLKVLDLTNFK